MKLATFLFKIGRSVSVSYLLLAGLIIFLLWAMLFDIDETIRAQGSVVANGRTQIIQVADGGVLAKLLVYEGQEVQKGELLASLEKDRAKASYHQIKTQVAYLKAALARARAEILDTNIIFDDFVKPYPDFMDAQKALYQQRKKSLKETISILEHSLAMSKKEWEIIKRLSKSGDVSQLESLRAEQKLLEFKRKITEIKNKYYEKTRSEIEKLAGELAISLHKLKAQENILQYTDIRSPVSGVIKSLRVTTLGGVLRPGENLMEISPDQGGIILEVKVNPSDIGRLKLGMLASIKLDAFDYTIFGGMGGVVNHISPDTLLEKDSLGREMLFYKVNVQIQGIENKDNTKSKNIKVKLGMSATVDIRVGTRSLFAYLTKPVTRGFRGALNEQ